MIYVHVDLEKNIKNVMENNSDSFPRITFPKQEWNDIKKRLKSDKCVYTIRVSSELGRYKKDMILVTPWGENIKIMSVKTIKNGISQLKIEYEFFDELTKDMLSDLSKYEDMEIIVLKKAL